MRTNSVLAVVLASLIVAAPAANAQDTIENPQQSTPTTLYFHIFDTFHKFVINTQPMDAEFFELGGTNFPTLSGTPINTVLDKEYDLNTIYGYSTAGPVEYDFIENGRPRFHPERGIAADVLIDDSVQPVTTLYLDVRDVFGLNGGPNYLPNFHVRVLIQEGDDPGRDADLDAGADIMEGLVTFDLADATIDLNQYEAAAQDDDLPPLPDVPFPIIPGNDALAAFGGTSPLTGNQILFPDEQGIIEVSIPMDLSKDIIPKSEAFNVRIDWYQTIDGIFGEDQMAEGYFRLVADPEHLPRLDFAIENPVYLSFIHPQVAANTLLIHAGANSPWGTYDLDLDSVELTIDGPSQPQSIRKVLTSNEHVHGLHDQDAQLTYLWEFREEGAEDGEYTISMSVANDAGTAVASGQAKFVIEGEKATGFDSEGQVVESTHGEEVDTPSVSIISVLALLGAALLARRWNA